MATVNYETERGRENAFYDMTREKARILLRCSH